MGLFSSVNALLSSFKQNKMAKAINPVNATYEVSPYTKNLYGQGRNLYQGRMAGANAAEQAIATNAASTNAAVGRNAGDASTALALAAGVQGQADQSVQNLALTEAQDKQQRFGVLSNVSQLMTQEQDKVYQDKLRKYYDDLNYKRGLQGAAMQNRATFFSGIDDTLDSAKQAAMAMAGMPPIPKSGGGGVNTSPYTMATPNYQVPNIQRGPMPVPSNRSGLG